MNWRICGRTSGVTVLAAALCLAAGCGPRSSSDTLLDVEGGSDDEARYSDREALTAPPKLAADTPHAGYLEAVAERIQPSWSSFLEDCRVRLPATHELNNATLETTLGFVLDREGVILEVQSEDSSGNDEFDSAALEIGRDLGTLAAPPASLISDDGRVYMRWSFARDVRQAGASQGGLRLVELPFEQAFPKLLAGARFAEAAKRMMSAELSADEKTNALTRLAKAIVGTGLASSDATLQSIALDTVAGAKLKSYLPQTRVAIGSSEPGVSIAAIKALGTVGDKADVEALLSLANGNSAGPEASATAALSLEKHGRASLAVKRAISDLKSQNADAKHAALAVLAVLPAAEATSALGAILSGAGKASRDEQTAAAHALGRQAVETPKAAKALLAGTESGNAAIRAASVNALAGAAKAGLKNRIAYWRALELLKDKDERVRAAAIRAAAQLDPKRFAKELPRIRAAGSKLVIQSMAEVLGIIPGPVSLDRLLDLSVISDTGMRVLAAKGLAHRDEPAAKKALQKLLTDSASEVRLAGVTEAVGDEQLTTLLVDDAPEIQARALAILTKRLGKEKTSASFADTLSRPGLDSETQLLWTGAWLASGD